MGMPSRSTKGHGVDKRSHQNHMRAKINKERRFYYQQQPRKIKRGCAFVYQERTWRGLDVDSLASKISSPVVQSFARMMSRS
jgi:hypothetical protein